MLYKIVLSLFLVIFSCNAMYTDRSLYKLCSISNGKLSEVSTNATGDGGFTASYNDLQEDLTLYYQFALKQPDKSISIEFSSHNSEQVPFCYLKDSAIWDVKNNKYLLDESLSSNLNAPSLVTACLQHFALKDDNVFLWIPYDNKSLNKQSSILLHTENNSILSHLEKKYNDISKTNYESKNVRVICFEITEINNDFFILLNLMLYPKLYKIIKNIHAKGQMLQPPLNDNILLRKINTLLMCQLLPHEETAHTDLAAVERDLKNAETASVFCDYVEHNSKALMAFYNALDKQTTNNSNSDSGHLTSDDEDLNPDYENEDSESESSIKQTKEKPQPFNYTNNSDDENDFNDSESEQQYTKPSFINHRFFKPALIMSVLGFACFLFYYFKHFSPANI